MRSSRSPQDVTGPAVGEVVHGIWGHRSEAVLPAAAVAERLWTGQDPLSGTFARVGSIALNALLAADVRLGDRVAVFGQGVIGLLATRLAVLAGAEVVAVDSVEPRLDAAHAMGAAHVVRADAPGGCRGPGAGLVGRRRCRLRDRAERQRPGPPRGRPLRRRRRHGGGVRLLPGRGRAPAPRRGVPPQPGPPRRQPDRRHPGRARPAVGPAPPGAHLHGPGPTWWGRRPVAGHRRRGRRDVATLFERLDRGDPGILQAVLRFPAAPEDR